MSTTKIRRGSCPRCNGRKIEHYVLGFPDIGAFLDDEGIVPEWIHFAGCVVGPGPSFDRSCEACGLRWTSWSDSRSVFSTWRDVRDHMGVDTNNQASEWLGRHVAPMTLISPFPKLDDPSGKVDVWNGIAHKTLRFPFTRAEWESTLLDIFDEAMERVGGDFDWAYGISEE